MKAEASFAVRFKSYLPIYDTTSTKSPTHMHEQHKKAHNEIYHLQSYGGN